jgi:hypothetical protein
MGFIRSISLWLLGFKKVKVERDAGRITSCYRPYPDDDEKISVDVMEGRIKEIRVTRKETEVTK